MSEERYGNRLIRKSGDHGNTTIFFDKCCHLGHTVMYMSTEQNVLQKKSDSSKLESIRKKKCLKSSE